MSDYNNNNNVTPDNQIPPVQQPEFEVPPQPVQFEQPQLEQPQFYQNNGMNGIPPKKSNKKLVGIIAACVGVAACIGVAVLAGPKIIDALSSRSKAAPLDRFKNAINKTSEEFATDMKEHENTTTSLENVDITTSFQIELGEYTKSFIPEEYSGLTNLSGSYDLISYSGQQYMNMNLSTPVASIATLEAYVQPADKLIYAKIPELSDAYIGTSFDFNLDLPQFEITPITPDEIAKLYSDEVTTLLDQVKTVEITEDTKVTAGDVTASYDKLTTTLSPQEFSTVVYNWYKRLTEERYIADLFEFYSSLANSEDYYSDITLEDSLNQLKSWADTNELSVALDLYLDDDDKIVGFVMRPQLDNGAAEIGFVTAKNKENGFELYIKDGSNYLMKIDGTYTDSKDVYNGSAEVAIYENNIPSVTIDIDFKDFTSNKDTCKGVVTISSSELAGLSLTADMNIANKAGSMKFSAKMAAMELGSFSIDFAVKEATSIPTLPDSAVIYTDENMDEYLTSADIFGFINNIYNATGIDLSSLLYGLQ